MNYSPHIWNQLKNITAGELVKALEKSGWVKDVSTSNFYIYRNPDGRRVTIHYHTNKKTYGPGLLKALLSDIHWSEAQLKKLKLIK
jgi:predicted RNA binding protein YcfA (HicA-like mRNA interferase family)